MRGDRRRRVDRVDRGSFRTSRSDDQTSEGTRPSTMEKGVRIPTAGARGERCLSVQIDHRRRSTSPDAGRAADRGAARVQRLESDDRARSAPVLSHSSLGCARGGLLRVSVESCTNAAWQGERRRKYAEPWRIVRLRRSTNEVFRVAIYPQGTKPASSKVIVNSNPRGPPSVPKKREVSAAIAWPRANMNSSVPPVTARGPVSSLPDN